MVSEGGGGVNMSSDVTSDGKKLMKHFTLLSIFLCSCHVIVLAFSSLTSGIFGGCDSKNV